MPLKQLTDYLDRNRVRYTLILHEPTYTATQTARAADIPRREMAKTVIVKLDGRLAMAVLPATDQVQLEPLRRATGAADAALAGEDDFQSQFPDCETGAMPPFGNLYGMEVFVSPGLTTDETICFNAGTHRELIRLAYQDFERLSQAVRLAF